MKHLIYSVEDDRDIAHIINVTLSKQGYDVKTFYNGISFFEQLKQEKPQMILLDMMLPDIQGGEILKTIRKIKEYDDVYIIIISANTMLMDKVDGLDSGADDYIEKPFNVLELMSRVNAHFRRFNKSQVITIQDVTIDLDKYICLKNGEEVKTTVKEFEILKMLFQAKGNCISREEMIKKLWDTDEIIESRTVDMHVKSLRKKIDQENKIIQTVYGVGYKVLI